VRYENQELHASVESRVAGDHCFVLGSITPPECQMVSYLLLAHTLKKEGATRVTGILPYFAYSREDKVKPGQSAATAWTGAVLKASGFDEIWTVDLHSEQDRKLFPIAVQSLLPGSIFRESLTGLGLNGACFVSPDQGAIPRCQSMMSAAGMKSENLVYFEKQRTERGIVHQSPSACEKLVAAGAEATLYLRDACVVHRKGVAQSVVSSCQAHFLHGHDSRLREYPRSEDHRAPGRARFA
jgi:ribose-phosphate pyrophosphokinase